MTAVPKRASCEPGMQVSSSMHDGRAETCWLRAGHMQVCQQLPCPQTDPEAAKVVFGCGAPLTMVPLEVTHTALATPEVMARIAARDSAFLRLMHRLLMFFAHTYRGVFDFAHPPLHDPLAVFAVACPSAFKVGFWTAAADT